MAGVLYIFAGFPGKNLPPGNRLHAGGIEFGLCACLNCCDARKGEPPDVSLLLEHDPNVQYRKEGVFVPGKAEELLYPVEYHMSDLCLQDGITWDWFSENWSFGNGVTIHKTSASPTLKTVVHKKVTGFRAIPNTLFRRPPTLINTHLTPADLLAMGQAVDYSKLILKSVQYRTEGWDKYEARWLLGTCPQEDHIVHLTWLVTTHRLPEFAYNRLVDLIEGGAVPTDLHRYTSRNSLELGKHFSEIRKWDGKLVYGGGPQ